MLAQSEKQPGAWTPWYVKHTNDPLGSKISHSFIHSVRDRILGFCSLRSFRSSGQANLLKRQYELLRRTSQVPNMGPAKILPLGLEIVQTDKAKSQA